MLYFGVFGMWNSNLSCCSLNHQWRATLPSAVHLLHSAPPLHSTFINLFKSHSLTLETLNLTPKNNAMNARTDQMSLSFQQRYFTTVGGVNASLLNRWQILLLWWWRLPLQTRARPWPPLVLHFIRFKVSKPRFSALVIFSWNQIAILIGYIDYH